jgi:hypothetical protein
MSHHQPRARLLLAGTLWIASGFIVKTVAAHEHHTDMIAEGEGVSPDPIDSILWAHILIQAFTWGILMPTGMVLGVCLPTMFPTNANLIARVAASREEFSVTKGSTANTSDL